MYLLHVNGTGFPSASPVVTKKTCYCSTLKALLLLNKVKNTKPALF